jgi:Protein of unknown function (DUF3631)
MTAQELLQANHISVPDIAPGRYYTTCPQCSAKRSKEHQSNKCLGVTIDSKGARWGCNHCGWTGPEKGRGEPRGNGAHIIYDYRDGDGALKFQKVRNPPGSQKRFYCRRPDGNGGWISNTTGIEHKPLYHWPEIIKAKVQGRTIAIVEGEKDADSLWALDIPATCNFDGATDIIKNPKAKTKWKIEYSKQLAGADLVVFNDNDSAGYAHADATCRLSHGIAKRVRRLDLAKHWPDIPKGGDVSDWLAAGHTSDELAALIEQAPDYELPEAAKKEASPADSNGIDDAAEIERLAKMRPLDYERARKDAGKRLGINRLALLDALVKAKRAELGLDGDDNKQGHPIEFPEVEPWPEPVDGARLLNELSHAIGRHIIMRRYGRHTAAPWVVHTYLPDCFLISPRLAVRSPVPQCGKTTLFDILALLVYRPLSTANITAAAMFRVVAKYRPTILVDEADTYLPDNDELRGIINSGHRRGGQVLRTVGDDFEVRAFPTYSALAISGIGDLPDTVADRSVILDLKRRLRRERIVPFRPDHADGLIVLARKARRWAADNAERVAAADPKLPDSIINRRADNWRPLFAIAEVAGGRWPQRVRAAALKEQAASLDDEASLVEMLLGDIKDVFEKREANKVEPTDRMPSGSLVEALVAIEGRPWAELGRSRKPLTQNRLARLLIVPENIRIGDKVPKGYILERFKEAFARYLGVEGAFEPPQPYKADEMGTNDLFQTATAKTDVADEKCEKSANDGPCSGIAVGKGGAGQKGPLCSYCGRPDGNRACCDGLELTLHRECEDPWIKARMREEGI